MGTSSRLVSNELTFNPLQFQAVTSRLELCEREKIKFERRKVDGKKQNRGLIGNEEVQEK